MALVSKRVVKPTLTGLTSVTRSMVRAADRVGDLALTSGIVRTER